MWMLFLYHDSSNILASSNRRYLKITFRGMFFWNFQRMLNSFGFFVLEMFRNFLISRTTKSARELARKLQATTVAHVRQSKESYNCGLYCLQVCMTKKTVLLG